ncbi:MAG: hypothetical protein CVT90_01145 [Candidatus Altiarchaeales archaeon HGW-Altiarchaeales-3]|nr:MAG: hypothetical protein CVT90_01145 [Candidatus Altiarchaeales archaeon HGW-Altiarchaeales-3]
MNRRFENIKKSLNAHEIIGLDIPDVNYEKILLEAAGNMSNDYEILYISINKPYELLRSKLEENKININKFQFIDCITRTENAARSTENCNYVSSPKAIDEIQMAVRDILNNREIDLTVIDSPSSLLTYYEHTDVLKFIHLLMTKLVVSGCKGIFPFQSESAGTLRRSIEMFVDEIVQVSDEKSESNTNYGSVNLRYLVENLIMKFRIRYLQLDLKNKSYNIT